jgi:hypothetical protein
MAQCLAPIAAAAPASGVVIVRPQTLLHLTGTDMYCSVLKQGSVVGVACAHYPDAPRSNARKGYAVVATEKGVVIERPGSAKPSVGYAEPALASVAPIAGQATRSTAIGLSVDDIAAVVGTHMGVFATPAVGGGNALGVVYLNAKYEPLIGTYTVGISNRYVTIIRVSSATTTKVVYRHAVY